MDGAQRHDVCNKSKSLGSRWIETKCQYRRTKQSESSDIKLDSLL